jgi:ADP-ribose pyrophosphatase
VAFADAAGWLLRKMGEGYSIDPKLFAGLYFIEHHEALFGRPFDVSVST